MASCRIRINDVILFDVDDSGMQRLISLCASTGSLVLDCPNCGLTLLPQARSKFMATGSNEFRVSCVGCGYSTAVRMYREYGFVLPDSTKKED